MEKKLKIALCVLVVILLAIIAFAGVYSKRLTSYESVLPEYLFDSELIGRRETYLRVKTGTEEKIYDKDGKEVESIPEDANKDDYRTEQVKINPDEVLTTENYKKIKEVLEGRLNDLGVEDFSVRVNEATGEVVATLADDLTTDKMVQYLLCKGDFSMTDSVDGTVLLTKDDLKTVSVVYGNSENGSVTVYLDMKFTKEGSKKLAEISKTYLKHEDEKENSEESTEDSNDREVKMIIEGTEFLSTHFSEEITSGELTISIGSGSDNTTVYQYATQGQVYAMLLNNPEMPVTLEAASTKYMPSEINLCVIIGVVSALAVILAIYMIIKYKVDGILSSIAFVSAISMLLIMLRYTATRISIGSIAAMIALMAFDAYFMLKVLKEIKENPSEDNVRFITYEAYIQRLDIVIVLLIIAVVFTFMLEVQVFSIGMTLFYGIISLVISNLLIMRQMLIAKHE